MKLSGKKKIALVLSGGGVKAAAFHIGVCLALREKGFHFHGGFLKGAEKRSPPEKNLSFEIYVGSSAGSVIATFLAAGYSLDAIIESFLRGSKFGLGRKPVKPGEELRPIGMSDIFSLNLGERQASQYFSSLFKKRLVVSGGWESLFKQLFKINGFFSTKGLEAYLRENALVHNDFKRLKAELYIAATQLNHSRKVIFGDYEETTKFKDIKYANYATVSEAVAASASLPPFFSPYGISNHKGKKIHFFDGEIRDTLSTHVAADHGADLVISSYSIQPYHFNQEMGSLHHYGIPIIFNQALYQVVQQKIESHIKHKQDIRSLINAVNGYLKEANIDKVHREKLNEILLQKLKFKPDVDYLYIHPRPHDHDMFFYDHFSLNPKVVTEIVKVGFRAGMDCLRPHQV